MGIIGAQTTTVGLYWDTVVDASVTDYFLYAGVGTVTPSTNSNYQVRVRVAPVGGAAQYGQITVQNGAQTFWVTSANSVESPPSTALTGTIPLVTNAPSCTITASSASIVRGSSVTLTWTILTSPATGAMLTPGVGSVSATGGSVVLTPSNTTDYTLTTWNSIGTNTCDVTVTVTYPAPTFTFTRSPTTILQGSSSTLSWSAITDATSAEIQPTVGSISTNGGSYAVSPTSTTTYTNTATGPGGVTTKYAVVTVDPVLRADFTVSPSSLVQGSSATLDWQTYGGCSGVTINNGVGSKPCGIGSQIVIPSVTTTYTMITSGTGGPVTNTATVVVTIPPPTTYALTVNSGSGDGLYASGTVVPIVADSVVGFTFDTWTGATVTSPSMVSTTVTMPANATNVTATYTQDVPPPPDYYTLTVNSGSGSGSYTNTQVVSIVANSPPSTYSFWKWTGDGLLGNSYASSTTVTMRTNAATVTANYLPPVTPPSVAGVASVKAIMIR